MRAWAEAAKARLAGHGVLELLAEWGSLAPWDAQAWSEELAYFCNQLGRMRYDEYVRLGLPVSSGAVESSNRHAVGLRGK